MPGPMLSITLERTARFGWLAGPLVVLGHGILELALVIGIVAGLGQVLTAPVFTGVIGVVGGAALIWLGSGIVKDAATVKLPDSAATSESAFTSEVKPGRFWLGPVVSGVTTSLSNPYWLLWWGTVGAGYVSLAVKYHGVSGLVAFYLGHISSDLIWFTLMAVLMATGGRWLSRGLYTNLLRILGFFLIFTATYFIYTGITTLVA